MSRFLNGKKAVVTGGTKGIGLAIAESLASNGAQVLICGRNASHLAGALEQLRKAVPEGEFFARAADVSDSDSVAQLFAAADSDLGGLDILINNAGSGIFKPTADLTVEEWNQIVGTNLSGAFYCSREALNRFRDSGGGWIINISSLAGRNPVAGGAAYNASKFGLNGMTEAMMLDHRQENVKVSYVMPGSVDTDFGGPGRAGTSSWKIAPEDIAEIVIDILRKPERTLVSRVEVRPARPAR